jgi:hypothetical protein
VSEFVDRMLVGLGNTAALTRLLDPPGDPGHDRVRALIDAAYDAPFARIHAVRRMQARSIEVARPLFPLREHHGSWTISTPAHTRADVQWQTVDRSTALWVDLAAELTVTLVLEVDSGEVESVLVRQIGAFASLEEFRAQFRMLDLDAFMAKHGIATLEDLREHYRYLLAEIRLRTPPPFDPADPANEVSYDLAAAILIRESLDVREALRAAKLARALLGRTTVRRAPTDDGALEPRFPSVPVVVFPRPALGASSLTEDGIRSLFAGEGVVAILASAE